MLRKEARMVNDAILQNIQTDNTWVDVETVAFLKNISKREQTFLQVLGSIIFRMNEVFQSLLN